MAAPPFGGAPQPAAISDAVQNLVDAIRDFGRIPTRSRDASEDERALAKRYSYLKKSIPNDILQELQALRGAPQPVDQPAAISDAVQNLVHAIREFGRIPNQRQGASQEERKLAKRWSDHKRSIPANVLEELKALSGAPQPVDQPAAIKNAVQNLVDAIREFGRIPNRRQGASQEERNLANRWSQHKHSIPANVLEELKALGGAPRQELIGQELIDAVKTLGFFPKETRPTSDEGREEYLLARKIQRHPFTPAQRIELNELKRTSVHPRVKMHRAHPFSQG